MVGLKRIVAALALVAVIVALAPLHADVADCYDRVLANCNAALDDASWWEKPAVGLLCTGMLAGCGFDAL
jgi:hypothetical protein